MPITIRDATANELVCTIDNNGQIYFGNGTPVDMLTIDGFGLIDNNGQILHGVGSSTAQPNSGVLNCGFKQTVTVATLAGRTPSVQIDTVFPALLYTANANPGHPTPIFSTTNITGTTQHTVRPVVGSFTVANNDQSDNEDPSDPKAPVPARSGPFGYRWL